MKICTKCKENKNFSEYYPRYATGKYFPQCKSCYKQYRKDNEDYIKEYQNTEEHKESKKLWRIKNRKKTKEYALKKSFNITLDQYNQMLEEQNYSCAICNRHQNEFKRSLAVDHSHKTGEIRGLLCGFCNIGIGNLQDDSEITDRASKYLKKFGT